jgi:hypothetical protein
VGTVVSTYTEDTGEPRVEVKFKDGEPSTPYSVESVRTVPTRKLLIGDRVIFTDDDPEYSHTYTGRAKFGPREKIPQKSQKSKPTPKPKAKRLGLVRRSGGAA